VPHGIPSAKVNGNIKYDILDLHPAYRHSNDPSKKWDCKGGQVYLLDPKEAMAERAGRIEKNKLKVILTFL